MPSSSAHDVRPRTKRTGPRPSTGTLYLIKQLELAVRQRLDEALREYDLTTQQYTTLSVLRQRPRMSSAELSRRAFVTAQSMNEMVLALERKGLMVREPSETDRRVLLLTLAPHGEAVLAAADDVVHATERELVKGLEGVTRKEFRRSLYLAVHAVGSKKGEAE